MEKYPKEQLWKVYHSLSPDLKEAIFSEKTSEVIRNTCQKNNLTEEIPDIAELIGYTLLGLLPPENFRELLENDLGEGKESAKEAFREINRFIFYPVKPALDQLYSEDKKSIEIKKSPAKKTVKRTVSKKKEKDDYLEPIE